MLHVKRLFSAHCLALLVLLTHVHPLLASDDYIQTHAQLCYSKGTHHLMLVSITTLTVSLLALIALRIYLKYQLRHTRHPRICHSLISFDTGMSGLYHTLLICAIFSSIAYITEDAATIEKGQAYACVFTKSDLVRGDVHHCLAPESTRKNKSFVDALLIITSIVLFINMCIDVTDASECLSIELPVMATIFTRGILILHILLFIPLVAVLSVYPNTVNDVDRVYSDLSNSCYHTFGQSLCIQSINTVESQCVSPYCNITDVMEYIRPNLSVKYPSRCVWREL